MAKKQPQRIATDQAGLTSRPFASLETLFADAPHRDLPVLEQPARPAPKLYEVTRTRKGGWPVHVEKRGGGKIVTIIGPVTGDAAVFLKELKSFCGAGGTVRDDVVEIQGDQTQRVQQFLLLKS
ncbi:MAG: translation initiation factor [Pseudomonadota bacterium]